MSKKPNFAEIASRNKIETTFASISGFSEQEEDLNQWGNTDKTEYTNKTEYTDKTEYMDNKKIKKESAVETKSKRLNLLVKPSFVENIAKIATMEKRSSNDLINSILEEYIEKNQDVIKKHDKVFGA